MGEILAENIKPIITLALAEDIGSGDITTDSIIPKGSKGKAVIRAKEDGVICGLPVAEAVFRKLDKNIIWKPKKKDGDRVSKGDVVAEAEGSLRALLTGERTALNFLQRMSGIATLSSRFAGSVRGLDVKILDTRKTAPGNRLADKYAVKTGGCSNHRFGLYDMVLIKDNHIKAAGSIAEAVRLARSKAPEGMKIETEAESLSEVSEALKAGADIIMLDNMDTDTMKEAVRLIGGKAKTEASGNVTLQNVKAIAETGVDFISVGALTHSVKALDISMKIIAM